MQTIGFTNEYYTLWNVSEVYKVAVNAFQWYEKQDFVYVQNLSKTLEGAKSKLQGEYNIDLDLRGSKTFCKSSELIEKFEMYQFTFGKLMGSDIRICDDIWQIERAMNEEKEEERREIAKLRLIELGELIQFDNEWINKSSLEYKQEQKRKNELKYGHFYNDGERVIIEVQLEDNFSFDTQYGTCFINLFRDKENRIFKYKGSNPPSLIVNGKYDKTATYKFNATIKHNIYNEQEETLIQRIKIV